LNISSLEQDTDGKPAVSPGFRMRKHSEKYFREKAVKGE